MVELAQNLSLDSERNTSPVHLAKIISDGSVPIAQRNESVQKVLYLLKHQGNEEALVRLLSKDVGAWNKLWDSYFVLVESSPATDVDFYLGFSHLMQTLCRYADGRVLQALLGNVSEATMKQLESQLRQSDDEKQCGNICHLLAEWMKRADHALNEDEKEKIYRPFESGLRYNSSPACQLKILQQWIYVLSESQLFGKFWLESKKESIIYILKRYVDITESEEYIALLLAKLWGRSRELSNTESLLEMMGSIFHAGYQSDFINRRLQALQLLDVLFQICTDFGAPILCKEGVLENLLDCIDAEPDDIQQKLLETLGHACSETSCRKRIANLVENQIHVWLRHPNNHIRTVAAVLTTKLASFDPILGKTLSEPLPLAKQLTSILARANEPGSVSQTDIQNAIEGLAFLSSRGEIKEWVVNDGKLVEKLFELCKKSDSKPLLYGVALIFHHLTMYQRKKTEEEKQVQKLREFAKDALPEDKDSRDTDEMVKRRTSKLVKSGLITAISNLIKSAGDSENLRSTVTDLLLNLSIDPQNRGVLVQQGAVTFLLKVTSELLKDYIKASPFSVSPSNLNETGLKAAQTIAMCAITLNPNIAFAKNATSLVRPLLVLSQSESQLHQFESLLALTNLASMDSDDMKQSVPSVIHQAKGLRIFHHLQFSENERVRCAATEAICNMTMHPASAEDLYFQRNGCASVLKMLMALSDVEDFTTRRAASGALAILAGYGVQDQNGNRVVEFLLSEKNGPSIVAGLLNPEDNEEILMRGLELVRCFIASKKSALQLVEKAPETVKHLRAQLNKNPNLASAISEVLQGLQ